jgi:transcriptional regulator with XRE-family HTH domain
MHSKKKTPLAVLRLELGLTVEEFAQLLKKSVSAITSLETGRLRLSDETAVLISKETGVALGWLLAGSPKEKPYTIDPGDDSRQPYTKELFEKVQAHKATGNRYPRKPERHLIRAIAVITPWLSAYTKASENGNAELAAYLMQRLQDPMVERLNKDDDAFLRLNEGAHIVAPDGTQWGFAKDANGELMLEQLTPVPKKEPLPPSPANAHRASGRKSASPRRRRRDVQAIG